MHGHMLTQTEQEWSVILQDLKLFKLYTCPHGGAMGGPQLPQLYKFQTPSLVSRFRTQTVEVTLCVDTFLGEKYNLFLTVPRGTH